MFGVLKGSTCAMEGHERQEWMGHICGVCLALRDQSGHLSRVATNYDAALISVLCEAQNPTPPERYTSHCPLRSQFKAEVTAPDSSAAQYAASIALVMASTKVDDHIEDRDSFLYRVPWIPTRVADTWANTGRQLAQQMGFATETIESQSRRQSVIEATPNKDFFYYAQPTELAVASAFQHTAAVAHRPQNADILYEMGRMFGRIMYLLDSYEDYASDLAAKKFNALATCYQESEFKAEAEKIFQAAYKKLRRHFFQLELARPDLARKLLVTQLKQRSYKVLDLRGCASSRCRLPVAEASLATGAVPTTRPTLGIWGGVVDFFKRRRRRRHGRPRIGCCEAIICCDCCTDCCCCCDCDVCECDDGSCEICECECCECCECSLCECCGEGCGCCDCDCG
ncbi:MAG: DUF5685 family protein [Chloroflexota bacterium]